jgi:hypothetical protein
LIIVFFYYQDNQFGIIENMSLGPDNNDAKPFERPALDYSGPSNPKSILKPEEQPIDWSGKPSSGKPSEEPRPASHTLPLPQKRELTPAVRKWLEEHPIEG